MGRDNKNPAATNTTPTAPLLARTSEYFPAEETPSTTTKTRTRRTSLSTTDPQPPIVLRRPDSSESSSSSSTIDPHKGTSRHIDHPLPKQPPMSAAKYAQDIEHDIREPLVSKRSDPSRAAKENAIKQKLRTYEALLALSEGYMPTTEQLAQWARYALRSSGVLDSRNRRLSTHGRGFVRDLRAWVEAVVELGLSKNSDDKIQEFIYNTSNAQISAKGPSMTGAMMGDGGTTSAIRPSNTEMQKMYKRLRNLGSLLYSSPEFRKLLNDASVLGREILADATSQVGSIANDAADKIRPSESETSNIDQPAEYVLGDKSSQPPSGAEIKSRAKEKGRDYSEQARKKSQQTRDDMESYLRQKFPKQRRDAVVNRLKRVLTEIQNNPDFQESVDFLMGLMKKYGLNMKDKMAQEAQRTKEASGVQTDEHFDRALSQAKAILMVFADGKPLDDISDAFCQVIEDVQNDPELQDFYNDATGFIQRALTDKNFVTSDAADAEAHRLYDRSQELLDEKKDKYRPDIERLFEELRSFRDYISNDRENRRVVETSKKVFNDLVIFDKRGQFKGFRKKVVRDLIDVVLPRFVGEVRYIPMPRIEYQDRDFDLILENVILESDHFVPYRMVFEAFSKAEFTNDYAFTSKYAATTRITIENINLFFKDASFILRKKTGLTFSDSGFFDIFMDGRGASAELILDSIMDDDDSDSDTSSSESYFHVRSVKVTIHKFRYNYNAYHSWAAALLAPVIRPSVRRLLARLIEQKIRDVFEMADREMHAMAERMRVASIASQGGGSVESWIRAVFSRPDMGRRHGGGAFKVNVGMGEVLFPGEHAPGSLATKIKAVGERVDLGGEGDGLMKTGWRNDIFDIRA